MTLFDQTPPSLNLFSSRLSLACPQIPRGDDKVLVILARASGMSKNESVSIRNLHTISGVKPELMPSDILRAAATKTITAEHSLSCY